MTWLDLTWAVFVLLALTAVVGGGIARSIGLRGLWLAAAAPAFTLTVVAGAAIVAPWLGVPWSVLPVLILGVLISGPSLLVRRRLAARAGVPEPPVRERRRVDVWLLVGLGIAMLVLAVRFLQIVGAPDAFSQTFDNIFHLNGVRFVLDTVNASSLHLGFMTSPSGSLAFYPAAWHALGALVVQLTGVAIPVASNALTLAASAVFWPLGAMLLTRTLFGRSSALAVATGAVAAAIPAFPILLLDYGVLYPLLLGLSVLPFALSAVYRLLGLAEVAPRGVGWWVLILFGAIGGMTLAHPGAFVALLALSAPMVVAAVLRWIFAPAATLTRRIALVIGFLAYLAAGVVAVDVLRPPLDARGWPLAMSMTDAVVTIATGSMWYQMPAVVVSLGVVAGVVWAIIERRRGGFVALAIYLIGAWLFFAVAALPLPNVRDAFTGSWYNNLPRLAAILGIAMVPLAAYGIARTARWIAGLITSRMPASGVPRWVRVSGAALLSLALVVITQVGAPQRAVEWASPLYRLDDSAGLVDADERALLERLAGEVVSGTVVAGDPYTGAALAYALTGQPVLQPHTLVEMSPDKDVIVAALRSGQIDPAACAALASESVRYVLDFGTEGVHGETPGFPGLAGSDAVRLVDSQGDARLYEVTGCAWS